MFLDRCLWLLMICLLAYHLYIFVCLSIYMFVYMVGEEGNDQMIREVRAYMVFVYLYGEAS